ncbi:Unknown protein, partial [Striga hermonthica]
LLAVFSSQRPSAVASAPTTPMCVPTVPSHARPCQRAARGPIQAFFIIFAEPLCVPLTCLTLFYVLSLCMV